MGSAKILVTGASGFVGGNLVRELVRRGEVVRLLVRPSSDLRSLQGVDSSSLEIEKGDLRNSDSLEEVLKGIRQLYHVAASYHLWQQDYTEMYESNVNGTRNILAAAQKSGVERVVYTSTVGALGCKGDGTAGTEDTPVSEAEMSNPYKRSKFQAEQVALEVSRNGFPVIIVNPSTPVGPWDVKPTPTGRMILAFLQGKMPAYLDTGLNMIHVHDCVLGHILAMEKGKPGEKYILGGENLTMQQLLQMLAEVTGKTAPKFKTPYALAYIAAFFSEAWARWISHREPLATVAGVRMAKKKMFFSSTKANQALGLPRTSVRAALADSARWFQENGYV